MYINQKTEDKDDNSNPTFNYFKKGSLLNSPTKSTNLEPGAPNYTDFDFFSQQQSKKENVSNQGNVNYNERNPFNSLWERSKNNKNVNYVNAFNEDTGTNYNTNKKYNNDNTKQYYLNQKDNYNQRHFYAYNIFDKSILNNPLHFNGFNYNNMNTMFKNQNKNYTSQSDNDNINNSSNQCLYPNAV
jgi:hypothetical protein